VNAATNARVVRRLEYDSLARRFPYPIAPFILVAGDASGTATAARSDSTPARLPFPVMDEGPHLGYAIQWFMFALIALVGSVAATRAMRRGSQHALRVTVKPVPPRGRSHG